jgi:hypothetical protein
MWSDKPLSVIMLMCIITLLPPCLYWTQGIHCVTLVRFNIGPLDIYPVMQDGQIPSRSLMSLSMIRGIPINRLYSHPVTDNVWTATRYYTPTSRVHSGFRSKGGIHHLSLWEYLMTFHNILCSILMVGQSDINVTLNLYIYVKTW